MSVKNAGEVLAELQAAGHNYNPEKQLLKSVLAAHTVIVWDANGTACEVKASDVEQYVAKGMSVERPTVPFEPLEDGEPSELPEELAPPAPFPTKSVRKAAAKAEGQE